MIIYCHLPNNKLYPGSGIDGTSGLEGEKITQRVEKIKDSVKKVGFMNPLSCGNEKDDGTYRVNRGMKCLRAAIELDIEDVPCIVYCREDQKNIPQGQQIEKRELQKFHKSKIERVVWGKPEYFAVEPVDAWPYNDLEKWLKDKYGTTFN